MKEKEKVLDEVSVELEDESLTLTVTEPPKSIRKATEVKETDGKISELTEEDVWGKLNKERTKRIDRGMIVARCGETCPIWGDILSSKTVTVICRPEQRTAVEYWLIYVYGADCVVDERELKDGRIAMRSEYQCW